jgi:chromosomal replication initiation ATPase DnaA
MALPEQAPELPGNLNEEADRIAFRHNTTVAEIISKSREQHVCNARYELMAAMWRKGLSTPAIGRIVGGRDHTTVLAGVKKVIPHDEYRAGACIRAPNRGAKVRVA